jgi:transposase
MGKNKRRFDNIKNMLTNVRFSRAQLRAQAVVMISQGATVEEVAELFGVSRQTVYNWVNRFRNGGGQDLASCLSDAARSGRPKIAGGKLDKFIGEVIDFAPSSFGYHATEWTAELLRIYLAEVHGIECSDDTVRRSIARLNLHWKRSRYELVLRSPTWQQAKGG